MNADCIARYCKGITSESHCSEHGHVCPECGQPCILPLCIRCDARAKGLKCVVCGSPWVYLLAHPDDSPMCRMCVLKKVAAEGLEDDLEELKERWAQHAKELAAKKEATRKKNEEIEEMNRKIRSTRLRPDTEQMFEDPK